MASTAWAVGLAGSCQHGIYRLGAGVSEKPLELQSHLAANGFLPECKAGDRNGDDH
jgi:hypothetical protein